VVRLPERALGRGPGPILIETPRGRIPLSRLATIEDGDGPNQISRDDGKRRIVLSANASGRALSEIVADIRRWWPRQAARGLLHHPGRPVPGAGGSLAPGRPAVHRLAGADVRGAVHALQVGALSALIMVNIPLALVGAVLGLWLSGQPLSVAALVGFITLAGISVRNGILKVSHYLNLMRLEGEASTRR
jgi:HME family heavy-metal exporter